MKSNSSASTKNAPKKTQNRAPKKTLTGVKATQEGGASEKQKTLIGAGPFQGLDPQNTALLPALISAIENDLALKGLDPSISRRALPDGLAYDFSVNQAVAIQIGITKFKTGTHLRFWIKAVFGHALSGPKRLHLLETLLQMNSMVTFPTFLAVTPDHHVQAQYIARVHDQLTLASIGDTIDRVVGYTMSIRKKLNESFGFAPLTFRGEPEEPEPAKEPKENERHSRERETNESPGPNGWVH